MLHLLTVSCAQIISIFRQESTLCQFRLLSALCEPSTKNRFDSPIQVVDQRPYIEGEEYTHLEEVPSSCKCSTVPQFGTPGKNPIPFGVSPTYGMGCGKHDEGLLYGCKLTAPDQVGRLGNAWVQGGVTYLQNGAFCNRAWCYVEDASVCGASVHGTTIRDANETQFTDLYYSYEMCGSVDYFTSECQGVSMGKFDYIDPELDWRKDPKYTVDVVGDVAPSLWEWMDTAVTGTCKPVFATNYEKNGEQSKQNYANMLGSFWWPEFQAVAKYVDKPCTYGLAGNCCAAPDVNQGFVRMLWSASKDEAYAMYTSQTPMQSPNLVPSQLNFFDGRNNPLYANSAWVGDTEIVTVAAPAGHTSTKQCGTRDLWREVFIFYDCNMYSYLYGAPNYVFNLDPNCNENKLRQWFRDHYALEDATEFPCVSEMRGYPDKTTTHISEGKYWSHASLSSCYYACDLREGCRKFLWVRNASAARLPSGIGSALSWDAGECFMVDDAAKKTCASNANAFQIGSNPVPDATKARVNIEAYKKMVLVNRHTKAVTWADSFNEWSRENNEAWWYDFVFPNLRLNVEQKAMRSRVQFVPFLMSVLSFSYENSPFVKPADELGVQMAKLLITMIKNQNYYPQAVIRGVEFQHTPQVRVCQKSDVETDGTVDELDTFTLCPEEVNDMQENYPFGDANWGYMSVLEANTRGDDANHVITSWVGSHCKDQKRLMVFENNSHIFFMFALNVGQYKTITRLTNNEFEPCSHPLLPKGTRVACSQLEQAVTSLAQTIDKTMEDYQGDICKIFLQGRGCKSKPVLVFAGMSQGSGVAAIYLMLLKEMLRIAFGFDILQYKIQVRLIVPVAVGNAAFVDAYNDAFGKHTLMLGAESDQLVRSSALLGLEHLDTKAIVQTNIGSCGGDPTKPKTFSECVPKCVWTQEETWGDCLLGVVTLTQTNFDEYHIGSVAEMIGPDRDGTMPYSYRRSDDNRYGLRFALLATHMIDLVTETISEYGEETNVCMEELETGDLRGICVDQITSNPWKPSSVNWFGTAIKGMYHKWCVIMRMRIAHTIAKGGSDVATIATTYDMKRFDKMCCTSQGIKETSDTVVYKQSTTILGPLITVEESMYPY